MRENVLPFLKHRGRQVLRRPSGERKKDSNKATKRAKGRVRETERGKERGNRQAHTQREKYIFLPPGNLNNDSTIDADETLYEETESIYKKKENVRDQTRGDKKKGNV